MAALSVFDMFKIGVGPSSSHTMGPWLAATRFVKEISAVDLSAVVNVKITLFGSLAKTGHGHGTDIAVQLGLMGHNPRTIDVDQIDILVQTVKDDRQLALADGGLVAFDPVADILFRFDTELPFHPNGMKFQATTDTGTVFENTFFSIGGGFIVKEGEEAVAVERVFPLPIDSATDLLAHCDKQSLRIADVVRKNELSLRSLDDIRTELNQIKAAMFASVHRGCRTEGVLPGGLNVKRRAARMATRLLGDDCPADSARWLRDICNQQCGFQRVLDWVSCFALAVNEENAAFGRVVTAPTNGSAGVIPAVMLYFVCFCNADEDACLDFLMTAAEIGCIFKKGATISAALGGCQAEIGVSSAMAAAALTEGLGGSPAQATEAAEIAMEHHLGMTCDPIGGLVQIPCIERNAMGAIKAITASQMALQRDPVEARVSLDAVVATMWKTAQDMNAKYKETSEGGLALQIAVNHTEC